MFGILTKPVLNKSSFGEDLKVRSNNSILHLSQMLSKKSEKHLLAYGI